MNGAAAPFRSHFAARAQSQCRPPIACRPPITLFSVGSNSTNINSNGACVEQLRRGDHHCNHRSTNKKGTPCSSVVGKGKASSSQLSSVSTASVYQARSSSIYESTVVRHSHSSTQTSVTGKVNDKVTTSVLDYGDTPSLSQDATNFQNLITSRQNLYSLTQFDNSKFHHSHTDYLRTAIYRGVQCAVSASGSKFFQPITYHRILSPSKAYTALLDIVYEVTFYRERKLYSSDSMNKFTASKERKEWSSVPAFLAVTINLEGVTTDRSVHQTNSTSSSITNHEEKYNNFAYQPFNPIVDSFEMERYTSACASIQNLLLSLHSEGLLTKWVTPTGRYGHIIRTDAFRDLIDCHKDEMVVGLILIGWCKYGFGFEPKTEGIPDGVLRCV
eukprot:scaffold55148_cov49-Cyclotella_meneghiniana.AAC.7